MSDMMRDLAEHAYTMTAHDYCANPVGSRDWTLFWRGWQAALAEHPAPGKPERSNRQFLTPDWIAAEDAAGGVVAAGALATSEQPAQGDADVGSSAHEQPYWFPAAARLALDLECLLLDIKDMPTVTRWWDSAHEALEHWRAVVREIEQADESAPPAPAVPLPRYGIEWRGLNEPIAVPMVDGYWTPWHLASAPAVPDERPVPAATAAMSQFNNGWNSCRAAMLAAAPEVSRG